MKFTCEKTKLAQAIAVAIRTVAPKSAIPALEGIHLRAGQDLQLTGFNLETGVTVRVEADIQETGVCVMPARLFFDIVRKLPDEDVSVTMDESLKVGIRSGIASFNIMALDAEEYPELPDVAFTNGVPIPQRELRDLISGTIFSVSQNLARPILTGCLVEVENDSITMVAVDGFRLARRSYHPAEPTGRLMKFVVPADALREVEKILADTDEPAVFTLGPRHILFEMGATTLVCRIIEGEFMDWRRVMPEFHPIKLKSPVRCVFSQDRADFRTTTALGAAHDVCTLAGDGKDLEIGFNCRYLLEALRAVPTGEVMLELSNALSPIVLSPCEGCDKDYAYMVLPVRLKAGS